MWLATDSGRLLNLDNVIDFAVDFVFGEMEKKHTVVARCVNGTERIVARCDTEDEAKARLTLLAMDLREKYEVLV